MARLKSEKKGRRGKRNLLGGRHFSWPLPISPGLNMQEEVEERMGKQKGGDWEL